MIFRCGLLVLGILCGCSSSSETSLSTDVSPEPSATGESPEAQGQPDEIAEAVDSPPETRPLAAARTFQVPDDFADVGILALRQSKLPRGAPKWARVRAEVREENGRRFLYATGEARNIQNHALARTTAGARARAELTGWTHTPTLRFSEVVSVWAPRRGRIALAQARVPVPADWRPGTPLPEPTDTAPQDPP